MSWTPPLLPPRDTAPTDVRGALYGSRLYDQPEHAEARDAIRAFARGPLALEIGIDHGMCLLDSARRWPEVRWMGLEIRKRRVAALAPHVAALPNCLVARADARTVVASILPDSCISWIILRFPTPVTDPRHLLLTPAFVASLERVTAPGGAIHVATDVRGLHEWCVELFGGWNHADDEAPWWAVSALSRRERVCRRDGLPVWRLTRTRP